MGYAWGGIGHGGFGNLYFEFKLTINTRIHQIYVSVGCGSGWGGGGHGYGGWGGNNYIDGPDYTVNNYNITNVTDNDTTNISK